MRSSFADISRFIEVDAITTHYLDVGSGPNLVLLHSGEFGGCAELSWEFVIDDLSRHFRVIAPDWLGFGRTDKVHDFAQGSARRIRHMQRFVEIMKIGPAHYAGNSMGGTVLAQAVAADPSSFPALSLTLISSGGFMPDNEHRRRLMEYDCTRDSMRAVLRAMFYDPRWAADDDYVDRRVALSLIPGAWECAAASRFKSPAAQPRPDFGKADTTPYEAINVPTLVIAGAEDQLRLPGYAPELAARIPESRVHVLDHCGHCPNIEKPGSVVPLMVDFIKGVEAARAPTG
ncbi:alpha/beta fold hydrolase [Roseomonas sp. BN140053]|uniref:alpha/beta fold hydrolase n=1 Tax=Roseomonas sp. BN140053 TaxID=3391898 RepID=UPI0039E95C4B